MYRTVNFDIDVFAGGEDKPYTREQVHVQEGKPMARTNLDVDLFQRMERVWSEKVKDAILNGKILFAGSQYRLSRYEVGDEGVILYVGPTDYREFTGTNVEAGRDPEYMALLIEWGRERFGDENAFFSNTLAICSAVETGDGKLIVGLRSDKVAEYPQCWHTTGGHPNPKNYQNENIDMFDAMEREVCGELGLNVDEIAYMGLVGLVRNRKTRKPELLFTTKVELPYEEITNRRGEEKDEHFRFFGVGSLDEMVEFMNNNQKVFSFPPSNDLSESEQNRLRPHVQPENTSNYFTPPGEAAWVLYLKERGVDVEEALPYLERIE